jgi:hypothetical protein
VTARLDLDRLVPVPEEVSRRAWECAFDLGALHSCELQDDALWYLCQSIVVNRDWWTLTWRECGDLFRAHRRVFPRRAA